MSEEKYSYCPSSCQEAENARLLLAISPFIFILIIAFSPLISAIVSISALLVMGNFLDKKAGMFLSILAIVSVVLIYSSRGFYPLGDGADDVNVYYENYRSLLNSNYDALFQYGGGLEVGLPLYLYLIGEVFGDISRSQLLIFVGIPVGVALISWFYLFSAKFIPSKYHALILGGMIVIYCFSASNLLLRQFCSSVILLYAISVSNRFASVSLLILSASFHITSIPFFILYRIYIKKRHGDYFLLLFFFFVFLSLTYLSDMLSLVGLKALSLKMSYYSLGGGGVQNVDMAISLNKSTLIILSIASVYIVSLKLVSYISTGSWINFNRSARAIIFMLACTAMSMHLAWFPTRLFLVPVYFVLPVIIFHALEKRAYMLMQILFFVLLCQRIVSWVSVDNAYTELWGGYEWWSFIPFYYFF
ncbi:EpsG family protein [Aeromonas veronii]